MSFGTQIMGHRARPYIENLRNDARTRQLMDSWTVQAMMEVEARRGHPADEHDSKRFAHEVAQRAVAIAMSFVLDNDGEYQMVCQERDGILQAHIDAAGMRTTVMQVVS